jgi:hypothetical protein
MNLLHKLALQVPAIRRVRDERNALRAALEAHRADAGALVNAFFQYKSTFDVEAVIRSHAAPHVEPHPEYLTNYVGVRVHPRYFPGILDGQGGQVEGCPIPCSWHACLAEWGGAFRAVDLARGKFTVIELGCGWGCWLNNTGTAARRRGLDVHLIGVEGDPGHIEFAREATAVNGFRPEQVTLYHGLAAATSGTALFPRQAQAGGSWGLEPIFSADEETRARALAIGSHDELTMFSIAQLSEGFERIDLLHVDIQGGEADLVAGSLDILQQKIAYMVIGTHSRQIEGQLLSTLLSAGWCLEVERAAVLAVDPNHGPVVVNDGVQCWRNRQLLPL